MKNFIFAGRSSWDFGLFITGQPYVGPQKDIKSYEVPGRSGNHIVDTRRLKNFELTYEAFIRADPHQDLATKTRGIKAWLLGASGYQMLEDSYDREYIRFAFFTGPADFEQTLNAFGQTELTFNCKPLMYSRQGLQLHTIRKAGNLINPEAWESQPYIKVYGSGAGNLTINNTTLQCKNLTGSLEIDSELGLFFSGTKNLSDQVVGNTPVFKAGINYIAWTGGITYIETIPRWCTP